MIVAGGAWETPRLLLRSEIANSSGLVGRYLMYHFQTYVVGSFPFRLHGHRGRSVTHLHDDHMIIDDDEPRVREGARAPLLPGRHRRARRRRHPIIEGMYTDARPRAHPRDARVADARPPVGVHDAGRRPPAGHEPRRPRSRACATCTASPPGARPTTCTRTRSSRRATTRPKLAEIMREAGAEHDVRDHVAPARRRPRRHAPARRSRGTSWARAGWATIPRTSVVDRWQRFHDVENMVCTDSSVFPTSTGYGPTLTIVALAIRACRELAGLPPLRSSRRTS